MLALVGETTTADMAEFCRSDLSHFAGANVA